VTHFASPGLPLDAPDELGTRRNSQIVAPEIVRRDAKHTRTV